MRTLMMLCAVLWVLIGVGACLDDVTVSIDGQDRGVVAIARPHIVTLLEQHLASRGRFRGNRLVLPGHPGWRVFRFD